MRKILLSFLILTSLVSCGRPLTKNEISLAKSIHGDTLDIKRVRLINGAPTQTITFQHKARPRATCRELLLPPPTDAIITTTPAAVTIFSSVFFDKRWFLDDYAANYPNKINLSAAMLLAHELTHVWQWQNRQLTSYSPLKAASEHRIHEDPYLFNISTKRMFSEFGYEQQGSIVEEFVCCRTLDPQSTRTRRLHALISQAMPVAPLPQSPEHEVYLPWDGVRIEGICQ